ncbi:MAG TPA: Ig-like domain-containing protein [Gemmatimonadaceae bacterium]|nr:Ig-like domain-containing protein [Gemmatimonadaceae bacterium]
MRVPRSTRAALAAAIALAFTACIDTPPITSSADMLPSASIGRIFVEPATLSIVAGADSSLNVHLEDTDGNALDGQPVVWVSSDTTVATVDSNGVVTARNPGQTNVVAIAGTQSAQAVVNVAPKAAPKKPTISVSPTTTSVVATKTVTLTATVTDTLGQKVASPGVTWTSDKPTIATVSSSGVVTGVAAGTAKVTATSSGVSASATVTVTTPPPPPPSQDPAPSGPGSLFSTYSASSPHWSHIRTLATDFYYHWTADERTWAGQHFDAALSGNGDAWRAVNPGVTHLPYTLFWTVLTPESSNNKSSISSIYYSDMQQWYAAHTQYRMEDAFLHTSTDKSLSTRVKVMIWDSDRYLINPADPGARAYTVDRYLRVVNGEEGVFIDEAASGDILKRAKQGVELTSAQYQTAYTSLLAEMKKAFGSKVIMLNTAEYATDFDRANAAAAGAVHLELFNNPMYAGMPTRWKWVEDLLGLGVKVDMVSPYSAKWADDHPSQYPKGNYPTSGQRLNMWVLASYYMVVGQNPDGLFFHPLAPNWDTPFAQYWFKALEANIGHPVGARSVLAKGTDPTGKAYTIYQREFDRALVLIRPPQGWDTQSYLDATAVEVTLPSGESWLPLRADGTLGAAVTKVKLRNSESLVLVKKSRI